MTMLRRASWGLLCLALLGEIGARMAGLVSVPLFVLDPRIGYLPAPNQSGAFAGKNVWAFNELSMGTDRRFQPGPWRDILLVGDSVVYGGPHYAAHERLGTLLEQQLPGSRVWPVAAGSWATRNELAWLRQHPEVVREVDDIVFVTTSEDFTNVAATWHCESNNPTHAPWSALWYLLVKKFQLESCDQTLPQHTIPDASTREELAAWLALPEVKQKRVSFVLYPFKGAFAQSGRDANRPEREFLRSVGAEAPAELAGISEWHIGLYKDDAHPGPQGNVLLAGFIARTLGAGTATNKPH